MGCFDIVLRDAATMLETGRPGATVVTWRVDAEHLAKLDTCVVLMCECSCAHLNFGTGRPVRDEAVRRAPATQKAV